VDTLDQHRELRRRERNRAAWLMHPRPHEGTTVYTLAEQAQPVSVPKQNLQNARLLAAKGKKVPGERILLQRLLHQHGKATHTLPHVGVAQRQVRLHARANDHHDAASRSAMCCWTASRLALAGAKTRRPSASCIPTIPSGFGNNSCKTSGADDALECPSLPATDANRSCARLPNPNCTRHRNSMLVTM